MGFYTDEQLSLILSADAACSYWSYIDEAHAYGLYGYAKNSKLSNKADREGYSVYEWLEKIGIYGGLGSVSQLLQNLEKEGLA